MKQFMSDRYHQTNMDLVHLCRWNTRVTECPFFRFIQKFWVFLFLINLCLRWGEWSTLLCKLVNLISGETGSDWSGHVTLFDGECNEKTYPTTPSLSVTTKFLLSFYFFLTFQLVNVYSSKIVWWKKNPFT